MSEATPKWVPRPSIRRVLETVLYFLDQDRAERFYEGVLGMRLMDKEAGRSLFFRAGESVFLLFRAEESLRGSTLPPHGATGPIHTCFLAEAGEYERWKDYLISRGVAIVQEVRWPRGESFYIHDPEGNLLEFANADIWPP